MQQGLVAAHQKLNKTVWEEVQIQKSWLKKCKFQTLGCPYTCSVPHEHLHTDRICGNLGPELGRRSGWAIPGAALPLHSGFLRKGPIRFIPNVRPSCDVSSQGQNHKANTESEATQSHELHLCAALMKRSRNTGAFGQEGPSSALHTFSNPHTSPGH